MGAKIKKDCVSIKKPVTILLTELSKTVILTYTIWGSSSRAIGVFQVNIHVRISVLA